MNYRVQIILSLVGLLVAAVLWAGPSPTDTIVAKYVITYADTSAYRAMRVSDNHRRTVILVPEGTRAGDTLLVAEIWEGVPAEYVEARQQAQALRKSLDDLDGVLQALDSLREKQKKP